MKLFINTSRPLRKLGALCVKLLLLSVIAHAQQNRVILPASNADNLPQQKIGPDDLIGISVYDAPELTRTVRVGADGSFRLPMLKQRINASGLFPADVETAIAEALKKEDIFVDPIVTVSVVEYRSRPINVAGAVKKPLTFQATGTITLLDALSRAEGLSEFAGSEILVSRSQVGDTGNSRTAHPPHRRQSFNRWCGPGTQHQARGRGRDPRP